MKKILEQMKRRKRRRGEKEVKRGQAEKASRIERQMRK